eukprot:3400712-Pleurochrysis_carterae.AAC.1
MPFWCKPYSSHSHLFPSAKGEDGQPVRETVDGKEQYRVSPYGIEILRTKCKLRHAIMCMQHRVCP